VDWHEGVERSGENNESEHRACAARWSADHWKTAVAGWLAFCVVAVALGAVAGTKMLRQADTAAGGTKKAEQLLDDAGFPSKAAESVLVRSDGRRLSDPAFRAAVTDVVRTVERSSSSTAPGATTPASTALSEHDRRDPYAGIDAFPARPKRSPAARPGAQSRSRRRTSVTEVRDRARVTKSAACWSWWGRTGW
jgi:hypothetical protein